MHSCNRMLWYFDVLFSILRFLSTPNKSDQRILSTIFLCILCIRFYNEIRIAVHLILYGISLFPYIVLSVLLQTVIIPQTNTKNAIVYELLLLWIRFFAAPTNDAKQIKIYTCNIKWDELAQRMKETIVDNVKSSCMYNTFKTNIHVNPNMYNHRLAITVLLTILVTLTYNPDRSQSVFEQVFSG